MVDANCYTHSVLYVDGIGEAAACRAAVSGGVDGSCSDAQHYRLVIVSMIVWTVPNRSLFRTICGTVVPRHLTTRMTNTLLITFY